MTDPLIASVAFSENFSNASKKRHTPTRIPYSCHAQLGRSGMSGWPKGGDSTVRGIARSIDHSSTLTMVQTATRAPPGSLSGGRSTMAEYGTRSLGCIRYYISRGDRHETLRFDSPFDAVHGSECSANRRVRDTPAGHAAERPGLGYREGGAGP